VVRALRAFLTEPFPTAFLFEGETGTGKTSAALALAAGLGCDMTAKPKEFGGLHEIASGEQTADTIRDIHNLMWRCPFTGSGWKVLIVNEADRMHVAAETIWLDRLEQLPPKTVIVFTTNFPEKLPPRFRDRCTRMVFESDAGRLADAAGNLLKSIYHRETGKAAEAKTISRIVREAVEDGRLSLRRAVQLLQPVVLSAKGGA
jgi:DNA polymerase III delta prime subunit